MGWTKTYGKTQRVLAGFCLLLPICHRDDRFNSGRCSSRYFYDAP
jgi:hypothetical protein